MSAPSRHHRPPGLIRLLVIVSVGIAIFHFVPGTAVDRFAFEWVSRGSYNPPFFIGGSGARDDPWSLRVADARAMTSPEDAPQVVTLGDDPDGIFQESPPSPLDIAVLLKNLARGGSRPVAIASVLAWPEPDPIALTGLELMMGRFDAVVTGSPVTRGAIAEILPQEFRRASLDPNAILGDLSRLPEVNRLPIPNTVLGGRHALAGFFRIESEPAGAMPPMLARWGDRVIVSFSLLATCARRGLTPAALEIRLGEAIRIGPDGPVIPISADGRMTLEIELAAEIPVMQAAHVIDATDETLAGGGEHRAEAVHDLVVITESLSASSSEVREESTAVPGWLARLNSDAGLAPPLIVERPRILAEAALLIGWLILLRGVSRRIPVGRSIVLGALAAAAVIAQLLAFAWGSWWLPGLAMFGMALVALIIGTPSRGGAVEDDSSEAPAAV